jgi:hypothetical protein
VLEIVPGPFRLHSTAVFDTPETDAVNCAVAPARTLVVEGVIVIDCELIDTVAEAFSAVFAVLVAVTVAVVPDVTVDGAVYKPVEETVPGPERLHVTPVEETPESVAENCAVPPAFTDAVAGVTLIDAGAFTVTVACAESVEFAVLVAVTVTVVFEVTLEGAVYKPVEEIVPGPERLQVTPAEETPESVAENCAVPPAFTVAVAGVTLIDAFGVTVTVAFATTVGLSTLVAATVTVVFEVTLEGAVYKPDEEIDPGPDTLQVTLVFVIPVACAANCFVAPAASVALVGDTARVSGFKVTVVEAFAQLEAEVLTVMVAVVLVVTVAGAVYSPLDVSVPGPLKVHVTVCCAVSDEGPLTVATNCWLDPASIVAEVGLTAIVTDLDCFVFVLPLLLFAKASPPQEMAHMHASMIARKEGFTGKAHSNLDTLASLD